MKVSVVIPVYNGEATIGRCLDSLVTQATAVGNVEILVVDDASTDGTLAVVCRYAPVRVVRQPTNAGPAAARNRGVAEASGELVLFTDADCVPSESWIADMVAPFLVDAAVVGAKGVYKTRQPEVTARFVQLEYEDKYDRMRRCETIDFIDTYSAAYRRATFLEFGGFDRRFPVACAEDVELSFRLAAKGLRMVFIDRAFVYHRHPCRWGDYVRKKYKFAYWRAVMIRIHPGKTVRNSHTPVAQKVQLFVVPLSVGATAGLLWPAMPVWPVVVAWGSVVLTMVPFMVRAVRRDWLPALCAPVFLVPRALAQCAAVLLGILNPMGSAAALAGTGMKNASRAASVSKG